MAKRQKNFGLIFGISALLAICLISKKIKVPFVLDIQEIVPEMFSLAAVNASYERKTFLEELNESIENEFPEKKAVSNTGEIENTTENLVNVVEKKVTYNQNQDYLGNYENVFLTNHTTFDINLKDLMKDYNPVKKKKDVQVLVIHTHATEGYADAPDSRTTDTNKNMIKVGAAFSKALKEYGFNVVHDVKLHDYPSYNGSYTNSLKVMNWYMEHYPDIDIIFDLHRDAVDGAYNSRVKFATEIEGRKAAQLMLVVGTNQGGLTHENWKQNLKFAAGLQNVVSKMYPDLMRAVDLRKERFNQHVTNQSVIVEVGSNGNSIEEAIYSVELLAKAINQYIK